MKFRVTYRLVVEGSIEVEADSAEAATEYVEGDDVDVDELLTNATRSEVEATGCSFNRKP